MRSEALTKLLSDLESFEIDLNHYYGDAEPQGVYDSILSGKIDALARFCTSLGWLSLSTQLQGLVPVRCSGVEALECVQSYVIPEIRRLMTETDVDAPGSLSEDFWNMVHPRLAALARPRFDAGFHGDAVEASFKEVNEAVKRIVKDLVGKEADGAGLMTTAFSPGNPIIRLNPLGSESDRNMQQGYMQIFAGAMTGIRNPKAHGNLQPDARNALHLICLASLLMFKLDERVQ